MKPYCFVITSFGTKADIKDLQEKFTQKNVNEQPRQIDFDKVYNELLKPAIEKAGMEPLIESQEKNLGVIQKTMYEKIILCEFCVADLTNANPNAYYELGMRYAVRPYSTIPMIASTHLPMPFDIAFDRTFIYSVDQEFKFTKLEEDMDTLTRILTHALHNRSTDSPLYDLVNGISFQNSVAHEKTDVFRDAVVYNDKIKKELAYARAIQDQNSTTKQRKQVEAIDSVIEKYQPLAMVETAVLIDMMLSYRNIEAFDKMLEFIQALPRYVNETVMVKEQLAFALNRVGGKQNPLDEVMIKEAETILRLLETDGKASSETYGIWGRIYKDKFDRAYKAGNLREARVQLERAAELYHKGFLFDIRDAYPAVNYVTCLELLGKRDQALRLVPVVEQAVLTKMARKEPDYWDYATLMELRVIENQYEDAVNFFYKALPLKSEAWMPATTKSNLMKILHYRNERQEPIAELQQTIALFE